MSGLITSLVRSVAIVVLAFGAVSMSTQPVRAADPLLTAFVVGATALRATAHYNAKRSCTCSKSCRTSHRAYYPAKHAYHPLPAACRVSGYGGRAYDVNCLHRHRYKR